MVPGAVGRGLPVGLTDTVGAADVVVVSVAVAVGVGSKACGTGGVEVAGGAVAASGGRGSTRAELRRHHGPRDPRGEHDEPHREPPHELLAAVPAERELVVVEIGRLDARDRGPRD